jgi:hypothetical protein
MHGKIKISLIIYILVSSFYGFTQDRFNIISGQQSYSLSFKLINNLIIIPINVNGSELNFLLDTGVSNSIMFNLSPDDSLKLKNVEKIRLRGLGGGDHLDAVKSTGNIFRIGKVVNGNHMIYLIPGKDFDLSSKMGININGIIGGDLFHDFIIEINYTSKRIKLITPNNYSYKRCKKCQTFRLDFYKDKPFINIKVQKGGDTINDVKLLIDSGGSDALWLFDKSSEKINIPVKSFDDYLGKGLSGNIYGKRAKMSKVYLGNYVFNNVNVSYPDSTSITTAYKHKERNGTMGSDILKRFYLIYDYPNKKITFKKKSKFFNDPFLYNLSGIDLSYSGSMLIRERQGSSYTVNQNDDTNSAVEFVFDYVYAFKQSYEISFLRKDSPAAKSGLLVKDVILQVNGKPAYNYEMQQIIQIFSTKPGKRVSLLIDRDGEVLTYSFKLKDVL